MLIKTKTTPIETNKSHPQRSGNRYAMECCFVKNYYLCQVQMAYL